MSQPSRRPVLGRGLSALIPGADAGGLPTPARTPGTLPIDQIEPASHQPRLRFDDRHLAELSASIRMDGLLQPILVRELGPHRYQIIAGERRFRAASLAGLSDVPVVVRDVSDAKAFELALVENVQREDLDPIEEAEAFRHLADAYGMTQEQIAQRVGKDRVTVANALRLLKLPEAVRAALIAGELTAGHARALLTAPTEAQAELARVATTEGWSVRETERRARSVRDGDRLDAADAAEPEALDAGREPPAPADPPIRSRADDAVEEQLRGSLGAPVRLVRRRGKGRIEIRFHSLDELERLIDLISGLEGT